MSNLAAASDELSATELAWGRRYGWGGGIYFAPRAYYGYGYPAYGYGYPAYGYGYGYRPVYSYRVVRPVWGWGVRRAYWGRRW